MNRASPDLPGRCDVVVVGAGIVGLATAWKLVAADPAPRVLVVDKEPVIAAHQTGRNSGVIHSGIYYAPGSAKATTCRAGRAELVAFCAEHGVPHQLCGKVIVACDAGEVPRLDRLAERGHRNGVALERLDRSGLAEREPAVAGVAALLVRDAGVVDFGAVAHTLARLVGERGGLVQGGVTVLGMAETGRSVRVETTAGPVEAAVAVNCAGLFSDRVAAAAGAGGGPRIMPFRGEYHHVVGPSAELVRHLIYPAPDPRFPFLGVHLTRGVDGSVHAGPNAVIALSREGYRWRDVSGRDLAEMARSPSSWRLARRHWRTGLGEVHRSLSRRALARALQRLVPALDPADLEPAPSGVRAQAISPDGTLVDDFAWRETARTVHVVNAPSPAATACLAIGREVADRVRARLG